jgi:predicted DNA-binding ribbon-helix-helix protein
MLKTKFKKKGRKPGSSIFRLGMPNRLYEELRREATQEDKSFSSYLAEILETGFFHKLTNEAADKLSERKTKKYASVVLPNNFHSQLSAVADMLDMSITELCRDILQKRKQIDRNSTQIQNLTENLKVFKIMVNNENKNS